MSEQWKLEGTYFESCNCDVGCPCIMLSDPTQGDCTLLVAWHIDAGRFGDVQLDGLNVAMSVYTPGNMAKNRDWKAALYLDESASEAQAQALTAIFGGQSGGHFAALGNHIEEVLGGTSLAMDYQIDGKTRRLRMANIAEVEIEAIQGQGGAEVTIDNQPLCIAPGQSVVVSQSKKLSYNDHGFSWELSSKAGFYSPFNYSNN